MTEAQRALVRENLGLVGVHLKRFVPQALRSARDWEDLFQEGCLGLIKAAVGYDPKAGMDFPRFAFPRIRCAVSEAFVERRRPTAMPRVPRQRPNRTATAGGPRTPAGRDEDFDDRESDEAARGELGRMRSGSRGKEGAGAATGPLPQFHHRDPALACDEDGPPIRGRFENGPPVPPVGEHGLSTRKRCGLRGRDRRHAVDSERRRSRVKGDRHAPGGGGDGDDAVIVREERLGKASPSSAGVRSLASELGHYALHRRQNPTEPPQGETIGSRLRGKIERALHLAGESVVRQRSRRDDRGGIITRVVQERLLVPQPESRAPLRRIARETGSSCARVMQCEERLVAAAKGVLEGDPEFDELTRRAGLQPSGRSASTDCGEPRQGSAGAGRKVPADVGSGARGRLHGDLDVEIDEELEGILAGRSAADFLARLRAAGLAQRTAMVGRLMEFSCTELEEMMAEHVAKLPHELRESVLRPLS